MKTTNAQEWAAIASGLVMVAIGSALWYYVPERPEPDFSSTWAEITLPMFLVAAGVVVAAWTRIVAILKAIGDFVGRK